MKGYYLNSVGKVYYNADVGSTTKSVKYVAPGNEAAVYKSMVLHDSMGQELSLTNKDGTKTQGYTKDLAGSMFDTNNPDDIVMCRNANGKMQPIFFSVGQRFNARLAENAVATQGKSLSTTATNVAVEFDTIQPTDKVQFNYSNQGPISNVYKTSEFDTIFGLLAAGIVLGVYMNFMFALVQRLIELVVLYVMSPITLAMYPFDGGGAFEGKFVKPFYMKVISTYAIILSINLYFMLWKIISNVRWYAPSLTAIEVMVQGFVMLAFLSLLPKLRELITNTLGAEGLQSKSLGQVMKDAKDATGVTALGNGIKSTAKGVGAAGRLLQDMHKQRMDKKADGYAKRKADFIKDHGGGLKGRAALAFSKAGRDFKKAEPFRHGALGAINDRLWNTGIGKELGTLRTSEREKRQEEAYNARMTRGGRAGKGVAEGERKANDNLQDLKAMADAAGVKDMAKLTNAETRKTTKEALETDIKTKEAALKTAKNEEDKVIAAKELARAQDAQKTFAGAEERYMKGEARMAATGNTEHMQAVAAAASKVREAQMGRAAVDVEEAKAKAAAEKVGGKLSQAKTAEFAARREALAREESAAAVQCQRAMEQINGESLYQYDQRDIRSQQHLMSRTEEVGGEKLKAMLGTIGRMDVETRNARNNDSLAQAADCGSAEAIEKIKSYCTAIANCKSEGEKTSLKQAFCVEGGMSEKLFEALSKNQAMASDLCSYYANITIPPGADLGGTRAIDDQARTARYVQMALSEQLAKNATSEASQAASKVDSCDQQLRGMTTTAKNSFSVAMKDNGPLAGFGDMKQLNALIAGMGEGTGWLDNEELRNTAKSACAQINNYIQTETDSEKVLAAKARFGSLLDNFGEVLSVRDTEANKTFAAQKRANDLNSYQAHEKALANKPTQ